MCTSLRVTSTCGVSSRRRDFMAVSVRPLRQSQYGGSGQKAMVERITTGMIHCVAMGILYDHTLSIDSVPLRIPDAMSEPIEKARLVMEATHPRSANGDFTNIRRCADGI